MKTKVLSTDLQIRNILTGSGCISFNFCKQIFGLACALMLLNVIAIPSATAQFTTGGYTVGNNNQNASPGWFSGPLCPPSNITSQTFPNWESSGIDVTYSYTTNGWDGDSPNKYVAPGNEGLEGAGCDDQFTVGINDAHCATFYHGAVRITNNIADVGGPAGSATGPHTFTSTYSQNAIISNFRIGSISNLGSEADPSPEWVHVEAYDDANNKVTINLANVTVSYIDCSNIITPGGGNIITDGTGGFYGTVQNFVRQGLGLYGNIEFSIAQPVKRIVVNFWRNDSSTDPLETAGRNKYGSYTIHQNIISLACTTPTATASATQPTCSGGVAQSNGTITINGFTAGQRYQYSSGATFNSGAATPASITTIPVGGVIASNLPNTTQQYTVRIYDATDDACFVDRVVSITAVCCNSCFFSTNWFDGIVLKFDGILGTPSGTFGPPHINLAYDAAIGPDGMLYVASSAGNKVIKFNPSTGVHLGDFVSAGSGGLATPTGLVFGPDGDLYVSGTTAIYKYDGSTGAFISKFVDNNPAGFQPFQGIEFGPDGHLYSVDNNGGYIRKYNGATGALMLTFTPGALGHLQDIIFGPDGNLYVVEQGNNIVSEWNPTTGAKISNFISSPGGGASLLTGASFGFDGNFYLAHWDPTGGISKYDGTTGAYIGEFVAVSRPKEVLFVCGACSCTPPTATAAATQPTCAGAGAPNNGTITINGFTAGQRYQYSSGATFNSGAATPVAITAIPMSGVITSTLPNTTQQYTVRIYDAVDDACFVDRVVSMTAVNFTTSSTVPACHANGTPEDASDDYMTFSINVANSKQGSLTYTVTATQGGNPIVVTLADGSPATAVNCNLNTPLRTPAGSAGDGPIVLTITDNVHGCTTTMNIADPGTCAVTCVPGTPSMVMYTYATQVQVTELVDVPIILPQFDDQGGTRTLTSVTLEYGSGGYFSALMESNSAVPVAMVRVTSTTDSEIELNGNILSTFALSATSGFQSLPVGISVPPQGTWPGDDIVNNSTIEAMRPWAQGLMSNLKDPRLDPRWVTTATGNNTHDDDIYFLAPTLDEKMGTVTYTNPVDLVPFQGTGNVPLEVTTLSGFSTTGGGGFISAFQATRGYAFGKVTYTYECAAACVNPTHNPPTSIAGSCTGGTPNIDATITVTGIANADRIGISTGATYSGTPAYAAATPVAGAMHIFNGLMHNTQYTIRLFNGADNCFTDVTITTASIACCTVTINSSTPTVCVPATNTYSLTVNVTWANASGTTLTVSSNAPGATPQTISTTLGSSGTQSVTLTGLTANATMYNVTAQFGAGCTATTTNAFTAPPACTGCPTGDCGSTNFLKKT